MVDKDAKWETFDKTRQYQEHLERKRKSIEKEFIKENIEVHNLLEENNQKVFSTVFYFFQLTVSKYLRERNWSLEVWLKENKVNGMPDYRCSVALNRPNRKTLFIKKNSSSIRECIRRCMGAVSKLMRREKEIWESKRQIKEVS
jgi:hypothetical protein